jgi:hypothetical protein
VIKRRKICSVLHRKVAEPHSSVCHRPSRSNVQAMQIGSAVHKRYVVVRCARSWSHPGSGSAGALAQCTESPGQRRVPCETPQVFQEPRPTNDGSALIDNTGLTANGEQRTENG